MISKHNQLLHHLRPPLEPPARVLCSSLELNWGSTTSACRGGRGVSLAAPGRLPAMSWSFGMGWRTSRKKCSYIVWLVVYLPLWKIWVRQLGWWHSQYMGKNHVRNHQPVFIPLFLRISLSTQGLQLGHVDLYPRSRVSSWACNSQSNGHLLPVCSQRTCCRHVCHQCSHKQLWITNC